MTATKIQPVAEICSASHDDAQFGERAIKPLRDISGFEYGTPLYAGAAPAAAAPQGVAAWMHPETLDVIHADRKQEWATRYGAGGQSKAEGYSVAMVRADQCAAGAAPALEAPAAPQQGLAIPDDCPHIIWFDDHEMQPVMFAGHGARAAALEKFKRISLQWNAHLFVRIDRNSRDDRFSVAALTAAPQAPAEAKEPAANLHDDGYWTPTKTEAGRALNERLMRAGSPRIPVFTHPAPQQAAPQAPSEPVAWMYQRHGSVFGAWFMAAGQEADDLRVGRPNIMAPCPNHYGWTALYAAPQAPNCTRCSGSGEDPEGYLTHGRGPDDHTVDGPCRECDGSGAAPQAPAAPVGLPAQGDPAALLQLAEVLESGRSLINIERKEAAEALRRQAAASQAAPAAPAVDVRVAIEKLPRYTYGYKSDEWGMNSHLTSYKAEDGKFLRRDDVLSALAAQAKEGGA